MKPSPFSAAWLLLLWVALSTGSLNAQEFPRNLVEFVPAAVNPLFEGRGPGYWDARIRERGWILREGDVWHMWYTGYNGTREGVKHLGYATSSDGLDWKRASEKPIFDESWVEDMMVVHQGDTYYMFAEGLNDQAQLLTSTDRVHWTRVGTLDVRQKDGTPIKPGPFGTPVAWFENGTWHLFYERSDAGVWLATSKDLKVWTNVDDEPVMKPGPGDYDRDMIAFNQIVKRDGRYYAYYHGGAKPAAQTPPVPAVWTTNIAVSDDLIHWQKSPANPLMLDNKSSGILVDAGSTEKPALRLYTMHDKVRVHFGAGHKEPTRQMSDGRIILDGKAFPQEFTFTRPGTYTLSAIHAGQAKEVQKLRSSGEALSAEIEMSPTGSETRFITEPAGIVRVKAPGPQTLTLEIASSSAVAQNLVALVLTPYTEGQAIRQAADGVVTCHARDVTVHSTKLQWEPRPEKTTIGYWVNVEDWASWDFNLTKPGEFQVEVLQGCGKGEGGSEADVIVNGQTLHFTVEDTGHFQNFKPRVVGTVKLDSAGECRLAVKPTRKAKNAIMDIRQVRLIPVP